MSVKLQICNSRGMWQNSFTDVVCSYPETKGLAIEECPKVFRKHWFWKRYALIGFASDNVSPLPLLFISLPFNPFV